MATRGIARCSSKRAAAGRNGFMLQSSYTWSKSEDTTQASTFFSDATNGTTSAFPEFIPDYNKGLSDFHAEHNWVLNFSYDLPFAQRSHRSSPAPSSTDWRVSGIVNVRSGSPLTVFVQNNRSRSLWQPSLGPGIGRDRPSYAPGFGAENAVTGDPNQWFNPAAFVAAAGRHVRQHRSRRLHRSRTCAPSISRSSRTPRGRGSATADASKCGSKRSTSSTAPTSVRRS